MSAEVTGWPLDQQAPGGRWNCRPSGMSRGAPGPGSLQMLLCLRAQVLRRLAEAPRRKQGFEQVQPLRRLLRPPRRERVLDQLAQRPEQQELVVRAGIGLREVAGEGGGILPVVC